MVMFPKRRGEHDNKPTPDHLYRLIVEELGYEDVCRPGIDFLRDEVPDRIYCNPPFSKKSLFVERACELSRQGKTVVMLLPLDPSTRWFENLISCGASIIIVVGRRIHGKNARFPTCIAVFNGKGEVYLVRYTDLASFLRKYL